jgi:hypothetical protein
MGHVLVNRFKNSICEKKKSYTKSRKSLIFFPFSKIKFRLFQNQYSTHIVWNEIRKSKHENGRQQFLLPAGASGLNELVNYYKLLPHYHKSEAASSNGLDIVCLLKENE